MLVFIKLGLERKTLLGKDILDVITKGVTNIFGVGIVSPSRFFCTSDPNEKFDRKYYREYYLDQLKSFVERVDSEIDSLRLLQDLPDIDSRIAFYDYFRMKLIALENIEFINKYEKRLIGFNYKVETSFDDIENKLETLPEEEKLTYFRDLLISDYLKIKEKYQEVCDLEFTEEKINSSQEESNNDI